MATPNKVPVTFEEANDLRVAAGPGMYPDLESHTHFLMMEKDADGTLRIVKHPLPAGLVYNPAVQAGDWPSNLPDPDAVYAQFYADLRDKLAAKK